MKVFFSMLSLTLSESYESLRYCNKIWKSAKDLGLFYDYILYNSNYS